MQICILPSIGRGKLTCDGGVIIETPALALPALSSHHQKAQKSRQNQCHHWNDYRAPTASAGREPGKAHSTLPCDTGAAAGYTHPGFTLAECVFSLRLAHKGHAQDYRRHKHHHACHQGRPKRHLLRQLYLFRGAQSPVAIPPVCGIQGTGPLQGQSNEQLHGGGRYRHAHQYSYPCHQSHTG